MPLKRLDHVNIRTGNLEAMVAFYRDVLGLKPGRRPPFSVGGAWLYLGDQAALHLIEVAETPEAPTPRIEHFAFSAEGMQGFIATLEDRAIAYDVSEIPEAGIRQVNLFDPDGNHVEVAFPPEAD